MMSDRDALDQLQHCIALAQEISTHSEAKERFRQLYTEIQADSPQTAELLRCLWQEVIAARRSAAFWQQLSESEKLMADQMLQSLTEARQNYLRLMQEM